MSTTPHTAESMRVHSQSSFEAARCTVVICTRNRPAALARCLEALRQQTFPDFDVLVVDSAPEISESQQIATQWGARYLMDAVGGLSRARNLAARACRSEFIAFLDDDSIPRRVWLAHLLDEFADPQVMVVTGSILAYPEDVPPDVLTAADARKPQRRTVDRQTPGWFELANFGGLGDGGNMAFRRAAFQVWPGFDERLGRGAALDCGEEHYAFFNLVERGYRLVYTPAAVVLHPAPQQPDEIRRRMLRDRAATVAYMTLLLAERPRYALRLLKFIIEAMLGRRRAWRLPAAGSVRVSRWRLLAAASSGLLLYLRLRVVPSRRISQVPASSSVPD